jgi:hypothetical protein
MSPKKASTKGPSAAFIAQAGKGRPKGVKNKVTIDVRIMAGAYGPKALETLAEIMVCKKSPAASRVAAAKEILERAYGKSPQPMVVNTANLADVFADLIDRMPA